MKIKRIYNKTTNEVKNIWRSASIVSDIAAPAILVYVALNTNGVLRYAVATVVAVQIVNILAKISRA